MTKAQLAKLMVTALLAMSAFAGSMLYSHEGRLSAVEIETQIDREMLKEIRGDIKILIRGL